jgi:hypothetical protein
MQTSEAFQMTSHERAEATWIKMTNPRLSFAEQIKVLREAFDAHTHALLADDKATIKVMCLATLDVPGSSKVMRWGEMHAALAALRRKAHGE